MDRNDITSEIEHAQSNLENAMMAIESFENDYDEVQEERDTLRSALRDLLEAADIDPGFTDSAEELSRMVREFEKDNIKTLTPLSLFVRGYTVGLRTQINGPGFEYNTILKLKRLIDEQTTVPSAQPVPSS